MFSKYLIHTNLWIAACALAGTWQTTILSGGNIGMAFNYPGFVFSATLLLYSIHRIIGVHRVGKFTNLGRFKIVKSRRRLIYLLAALSSVFSFYFFLKLRLSTQLLLVIPSAVALLYVLPVLKGNSKRLRDLDFVKAFLIAPVWAWVTVVAPAGELSRSLFSTQVILFSLERIFFLFALTIPFDIRDLEVDRHTQVKTIPAIIGVKKSNILSVFSLIAMSLMTAINYALDGISLGGLSAIFLSALTAAFFILRADEQKPDWYFSGLLDGMMILQFALVWFLH